MISCTSFRRFAGCTAVLASASFAAATLPAQSIPKTPLPDAQISAKLDPQMAVVIDTIKAGMGTPIYQLNAQDARQQLSAGDAAKVVARKSGKPENKAPMPVGKITDGMTIPGPDGNMIPIRIYTPAGPGPFPVVLYFHGGGFVIATIDTYDASPRALANYVQATFVSVEYRKSPEAPFPAAYNDAIAAYKWVLANAASFGGNPAKVAVAGESAGGNLATEVALAARDQGLQMPTHELLVYPVTSSNTSQPSDIAYQNAVPLGTPALPWFYSKYVPDMSQAKDPRVSPINAQVKGLPSTTIIAAEIDPLQSDGKAYNDKLKQAGVQVEYKLYPGTTHEFFGMGSVVDKAKEAEMYAASRLSASFK